MRAGKYQKFQNVLKKVFSSSCYQGEEAFECEAGGGGKAKEEAFIPWNASHLVSSSPIRWKTP